MGAILTGRSLILLVAGSLAVAVLGAGCLLSGCGHNRPEQLSPTSRDTLDSVAAPFPAASRAAAPVFAGTTLGGERVSTQGFKGKPLVLVFWAPW